MEKHAIGDLMEKTMSKIREMVDVNTIVGSPITTVDGITLIPVSKVSFGFAAGGSDFQTKNGKDAAPDAFGGYDQATNPDTVLLAPPPYDEIYRFFLEMHIDLVNQEYDRYNNSAALYAASWGRLSRMWHREHRPLSAEGAHMNF